MTTATQKWRRRAMHGLVLALVASWCLRPIANSGFASQSKQQPETVWFWFATCGGPLLTVEVTLDKQELLQQTMPLCHASRESAAAQGGQGKIALSFRATRALTFTGYRQHADRTRPGETLTLDLWEGGADENDMIIGMSVKSRDRILMNTLHIANPQKRTESEIARGLVVAMYPAKR